MTVLLEHPTRVRVAVARLLADLCGVRPHRVRFARADSGGDDDHSGVLTEVIVPGLFGPNSPLTAFLCHSPTPREPHAFDLRVFVDADHSFVVGRAGLLIRPSFRDPTTTDYDPFHRQLVTPPPAQDDEAGAEIRSKFRTLYLWLIGYCREQLAEDERSGSYFARDDQSRSTLQTALVRLYQCRSLLNPAVQTLSYALRSHSPAAFRPVAQLADRRLAGWRALTAGGLNLLLDALLPTAGAPPGLDDDGLELYTAVGWLGPPLPGDHPTRVEGSLLFAVPPEPIVAPEQIVFQEPVPESLVFDFDALTPLPPRDLLETTRRIMESEEGRLFRSLGFPPNLINQPSGYSSRSRPFPDVFGWYSETGRSSAGNPPLSNLPRPSPLPTPPPPRKTEITVTDVPEGLFDAVLTVLARALVGQAAALPDVEFRVESDSGRSVKLEPTPAPAQEPPPQAAAGRGLLLD